MSKQAPVQTVDQRVKQLRRERKTGSQIATILRDEGVTINEAQSALTADMFVTGIHGNNLHVAKRPSNPATFSLSATQCTKALPHVVFEQ